jgi:ubiquinone/menaquinone biosynthesis C-methylase UbiE
MKKVEIATSKLYAKPHLISHKTIPKWKINFIPKVGKVLDVGCASGDLSDHISKERYYGVDVNMRLVDFCRKKGLKVKVGRAEKIPYDSDFFDCLFVSHVLEHMDVNLQYRALKEFHRVLKKGGTLLLFAPTPFDIRFWDTPDHIRPLTHNSLIRFAETVGFREIDTFYSRVRFFPRKIQFYLRSVPYFLSEVVLISKK